MRRRSIATIAAGLSLALAAASIAAPDEKQEEKSLTIGDAAPAIELAHWIKGDTVEEFEKGKVYVVEFWATWCGPCIVSMPHISELQDKYRDTGVTIMGISDEPLQRVVSFLARKDSDDKLWYEKITYTLATDPPRSAHRDYMQAAGQRGIPTAFIVGKTGYVEWIGHPMNMDDVLEAVVNDEWDRNAFKSEFAERQERQLQEQRVFEEIQKAEEAEDWDTLLGLLDRLVEQHPDHQGYKLHRFYMLLTSINRPEEAYAYGRQIMEAQADDAFLLHYLALITVDEDGVAERDLDFALAAAKRANEANEEKNAWMLGTMARVYHAKGDLENAIRWQRKGVDVAVDDDEATAMRDRLEQYEAEARGDG